MDRGRSSFFRVTPHHHITPTALNRAVYGVTLHTVVDHPELCEREEDGGKEGREGVLYLVKASDILEGY